jgi:hypothetical protein
VSGLAAVLLFAGGAVGAWLLRRAWTARGGGAVFAWCGWGVLAATLIAASMTFGTVRGGFIALALIPIAGLAVVASGLQVRAARARVGETGLAPEPSERPSTAWRGVLRWLLAGPIGMVAALAVGVCYAVWVPGPAQTRLLIAGLIVPVAWGGAMAWTLADNRILRATAVLSGTAIVGFAAAALRGFQ